MESATTHGQQVINVKMQGRSDKEICGHKTQLQFQSFLVKSKPSLTDVVHLSGHPIPSSYGHFTR